MTALSFRGLLEGTPADAANRTVVLSGLQSFRFFGDSGADGKVGDADAAAAAAAALANGSAFQFRLAVSMVGGVPYKFVCCRGACPGAPSTVSGPGADGYTRLLFDTASDPYDMVDLKWDLPEVLNPSIVPSQQGFVAGLVFLQVWWA